MNGHIVGDQMFLQFRCGRKKYSVWKHVIYIFSRNEVSQECEWQLQCSPYKGDLLLARLRPNETS